MRNDAENIKILDQLKPQFEQLRNAKTRLSVEAEMVDAEILAEEQRALEILGTSDDAEMNEIISAAWQDNSSVVDEFVQIISGINQEYRQLAGTSEAPVNRPMAPGRPVPVR